MRKYLFIIVLIQLLFQSCNKEYGCTDPSAINYSASAKRDNGECEYYNPTYTKLNIPASFEMYLPPPTIPSDNLLTEEGIRLGRTLFYDKILSGDETQSCASCHNPLNAFTDNNLQYSVGIDGISGDRNSMPIFNLAWNIYDTYFWDGRASSIEDQALGPVVNPIEMHDTWSNAVNKLQNHPTYPKLFLETFGTSKIDSSLVAKAISQFERTLISGDSKFDQYIVSQKPLTPSELNGFSIYMDEGGGDCFHCHGDPTNPLWTDNKYHNNGLDATFADLGLGAVTGNPNDNGKFKTPSLRNLAFTAPYMHDGRFNTLDEVILHYSIGLQNSPTIDPLMKNVSLGGVQLTPQEMTDLKAFLLSLSDSSFINNPNFHSP